jgi:hypothetical protein
MATDSRTGPPSKLVPVLVYKYVAYAISLLFLLYRGILSI